MLKKKLVAAPVLHVGARQKNLHLLRQITRSFHATALGRKDELGSKCLHGLGTLDGQVLRHDQYHAVTLDGCSHRQGNAGIPGSGLNQGIAGGNLTALLGTPDHGQSRPVFHRPRRVVAFEFSQDDVVARSGVLVADTLQGDQGSAANHLL